ncbi:MAG: hypothetical protein JXR53_00520 [Bacteroidales bacterium]|nr:hypothetical protein [Bacteroidales bacterium]
MERFYSDFNYDGKRFRIVKNTRNGETSTETIFHYKQIEKLIIVTYDGGDIVYGQMLGIVGDDGTLSMKYHHLNCSGVIMTGVCVSKPEFMKDGRIRIHETWEWTSDEKSKGKSIIEEIE